MRQNVDSVSGFNCFVGKVEKSATRDNSRVVNQNIDLADFMFDFLRNFVDLILVRNINNVSGTIETLSVQRIRCCFDGCEKMRTIII